MGGAFWCGRGDAFLLTGGADFSGAGGLASRRVVAGQALTQAAADRCG
jgi:hypothetical protein